MVVLAKVPQVQSPPVSRANSSQPIPRAKGKVGTRPSQQKEPENGESKGAGHLINSASVKSLAEIDVLQPWIDETKPVIRNQKPQKPKHKPFRFRDILQTLFFLFFTAYALSVCPYDTNGKVPVCHALSQYRYRVLEPYVITPFRQALTHPSVAPHVRRAIPSVIKVDKAVTPVVYGIRGEWNRRVLPQWKKRVVPYWRRHAVPRLRTLDRQIDPYRKRFLTVYHRHVLPTLHRSYIILLRIEREAEPHITYAAGKARQGYYSAKTHWIPVWKQIKVLFHRVLAYLLQQRRLFVDPHVARMWEKVLELSSGRQTKTNKAPIKTSMDSPDKTVVSKATTSRKLESISSSSSPVAAPDPSTTSTLDGPTSSTPSSAKLGTVASSATSVDPSTTEYRDRPPSSSSSNLETLESASSVISASASGASSIIDPVAEEIRSTTEEVHAFPEEELDEDLVELAMDLDEEEPVVDEPVEVEETISEEELAERERIRREKVAARRADIEGRHTQWEQKMDEKLAQLNTEYVEQLKALRDAAVLELQGRSEIRAKVDAFVADAQKYLRLCEAYLKKLRQSTEEDKLMLWITRTEKVEKKYNQRLEVMETDVRSWFSDIVEKEIVAGRANIASLKQIADHGQEDIGMDYAWLDDVDVDDWTRYHDLMRRVWNFTDWVNMMQNGTHVDAPANPIQPALEILQNELLEVAEGFMARLKQMTREGIRTLRARPEEPEVSILPVDQPDRNGDRVLESDPTLKRSQEEVLEALARAERGQKEQRRAKARARRDEL